MWIYLSCLLLAIQTQFLCFAETATKHKAKFGAEEVCQISSTCACIMTSLNIIVVDSVSEACCHCSCAFIPPGQSTSKPGRRCWRTAARGFSPTCGRVLTDILKFQAAEQHQHVKHCVSKAAFERQETEP